MLLHTNQQLADVTSHQCAIADFKSFEPARGGCRTFSPQISVLAAVCAVAFACPDHAGCGLPAVAPPVAHRLSYPAGSRVALTSEPLHTAWAPTLRDTCVFGDAGCGAPGFRVEWPYLDQA